MGYQRSGHVTRFVGRVLRRETIEVQGEAVMARARRREMRDDRVGSLVSMRCMISKHINAVWERDDVAKVPRPQ